MNSLSFLTAWRNKQLHEFYIAGPQSLQPTFCIVSHIKVGGARNVCMNLKSQIFIIKWLQVTEVYTS